MKVSGKFDVKLAPVEFSAEGAEGAQLGRMTIDKQFEGTLTGVSKGEMLSAMTAVKGSAGYVAIEQFVGELDGKAGSFILQHYGIMADGDDRLTLEVVPNSGTRSLAGISGRMVIRREEEGHFYDFEYALN